METTRFDSLAKMLASGSTRRRLVTAVAALGIGGLVGRPAERVSASFSGCPALKCDPPLNIACYENSRGKCYYCKCSDGREAGTPSSARSGITGGGLVRTDGGTEAHLLLLATRTPDPTDAETFNFEGLVRWTDPAWEGGELQLESAMISGYGPTEGVDGGRDVYGWVRASAVEAMVPFFLQVVDAGGPGSGQDTVKLLVGDIVPPEAVLNATAPTIGFAYTAEGTLVSGDLSLVSLLEFGDETVPGTPVA
jgi:hypothetical protein